MCGGRCWRRLKALLAPQASGRNPALALAPAAGVAVTFLPVQQSPLLPLAQPQLFLLLAQSPIQPETGTYLPRTQEKLIRHLRDHIVGDELHYSSLQELAAEHGISVSFLQKSFKQVYGVPVYQYLKAYRLEKAAVLLRNSKRSVTKIALDTGYTNPAKFSEAFRKLYGLPPSEYRKRKNQNG